MWQYLTCDYQSFFPWLFEDSLGNADRGVSVHHVANVLQDQMLAEGLAFNAKVYELEPVIIRPKGEYVLCPRDGQRGAAYVDCIYGADQAGVAHFMLSYTWGYTIADISDTLLEVCMRKGLDPKRTYIWICCFCINQHRVQEMRRRGETVPFETFERSFGERVTAIGKVIAMMSPWRSPIYLTRVWCDYEFFAAVEANVEVEIAMPTKEAEDLLEALQVGSGIDKMWAALTNVSVEDAQASVPSDRMHIVELIKKGPGFGTLNKSVSKHLQQWIIKTAETHCWHHLQKKKATPTEGDVSFCAEVGNLLRKVCELDRAMQVLQHGREIALHTSTLESLVGAKLLRHIGVVKRDQGDFDGACVEFEASKQILERLGLFDSSIGAFVAQSIGINYREQGKYDSALEHFNQAKTIRMALGELSTASGAELLLSIGKTKRLCGDEDGAIVDLQRARSIMEEYGDMGKPGGADILVNLAALKRKNGDLEGALEDLRVGREIVSKLGLLDSSEGATSLHRQISDEAFACAGASAECKISL